MSEPTTTRPSPTRPWTYFDRWVESGPFTSRDLNRYRTLYAAWGLLSLPAFHLAGSFPQAAFRPPLGPFRLLSGFPSPLVMWTVEIVLAAALAALLVNFHTRVASVVVTLGYLVGFGVRYSLGKIDHDTILMLLVPLVLAGVWGHRGDDKPRQWPMRLLACIVGAGLLTAARPKYDTGWLDRDSQASMGHFIVNYYQHERDNLLAGAGLRMTSPAVWEFFDWATVLVEGGVIVAAIRWGWFRLALAGLALFHLGVWLFLNIDYFSNVVVYAAFVAWGSVHLPALGNAFGRTFGRSLGQVGDRLRRVPTPAWIPVLVLLAVSHVVRAPGWATGAGLVAAGTVGGAYIAYRAVRTVGHLRSLRSVDSG
ncbi:MAG TPA: hypothetical protein VNQ73_13305 [Ilumatobacter sp.]|nr:hypothetical protein [Ilumatobacter sp.]